MLRLKPSRPPVQSYSAFHLRPAHAPKHSHFSAFPPSSPCRRKFCPAVELHYKCDDDMAPLFNIANAPCKDFNSTWCDLSPEMMLDELIYDDPNQDDVCEDNVHMGLVRMMQLLLRSWGCEDVDLIEYTLPPTAGV